MAARVSGLVEVWICELMMHMQTFKASNSDRRQRFRPAIDRSTRLTRSSMSSSGLGQPFALEHPCNTTTGHPFSTAQHHYTWTTNLSAGSWPHLHHEQPLPPHPRPASQRRPPRQQEWHEPPHSQWQRARRTTLPTIAQAQVLRGNRLREKGQTVESPECLHLLQKIAYDL